MANGKVVLKIVLVLVGVVLLVGGWLYVQSVRVPQRYRPASLTREQREEARARFYGQLMDLNNSAQDVHAFDWTIEEERLNEYLDSLEEIAAASPGAEPGAVHRALERAGLRAPAVDLHDGGVTLMAQVRQAGDRVMSMELGFELNGEGDLQVRLLAAHMGRISMPLGPVRERLAEMQRELAATADASSEPQAGPYGGLSADSVARAVATLLSAIDADPIPATARWDGKTIRLTALRLTDGEATLSFQPVR